MAYLTGGDFYESTSFWIGNLIWDAKSTLATHSGGDVDDQWRVFDGGNNLRLSFMRGLTLILR